jgi:hypothetical protein
MTIATAGSQLHQTDHARVTKASFPVPLPVLSNSTPEVPGYASAGHGQSPTIIGAGIDLQNDN